MDAERTPTTIRLRLGAHATPLRRVDAQDLDAAGRAALDALASRAVQAESAVAVWVARHDALLETTRAIRRDYDAVRAERDRLRLVNMRLRFLVWGTAPMRWLGWLRKLGCGMKRVDNPERWIMLGIIVVLMVAAAADSTPTAIAAVAPGVLLLQVVRRRR